MPVRVVYTVELRVPPARNGPLPSTQILDPLVAVVHPGAGPKMSSLASVTSCLGPALIPSLGVSGCLFEALDYSWDQGRMKYSLSVSSVRVRVYPDLSNLL